MCVCGFCLWQLYNEEILDLFDGAKDPESRSRKSSIKIHEDAGGSIYTSGVTSRLVQSEEEVCAVFSSSLVLCFFFVCDYYQVYSPHNKKEMHFSKRAQIC